jgi:hypothetical protein
MATYQCVTCGGVYDDRDANGVLYFHACPPDRVTTPATFDLVTGLLKTPEVRTPTANPRNENVRPDLVYVNGHPKIVARDPTDASRQTYTDATSFILAEGAGRAPYDRVSKTAGAVLVGPTVPGK